MSETPDNIVPLTPKAVSTMEAFLAEHERELLTILFTDLVDSTQLQSELGNAEAARLVQIHRRLVREELEKHNSREVEWAGDSCLAVFSMPSDGVRFALTMQAAMRRARRDEPNLPRVRVGLHLGEIFVHKQRRGAKKTEELFGLQVSEASRVMSLASGDQIYMSRPVYDNARSSMKGSTVDGVGNVVWQNHGPFILKGSDEHVEVCEVGEQGHAPFAPPEANEKCRPASASREVEVITPEIIQPVRPVSWSPMRSLLRSVLLVLLAAILSGGTVWLLMRPAPRPVQRFSIAPDIAEPFLADYGNLAISPDGSRIVYAAGNTTSSQLYVRSIGQHDVRALSGTESAVSPFFSPDGEWVAFFTMPQGKLKKVSIHGGAVLTLCDATGARGGTWGKDNVIIFAPSPNLGLWKVPAEGGAPEELSTVERGNGELSHRWPQHLPDGKTVLFTIKTSANLDEAGIGVLSLQTGEHRTLLSDGTYPRYASTGHVTFGHAGTLMAFPFDLDSLKRTGSPGPVINTLSTSSLFGGAAYAFSDTGLLVYAHGASSGDIERSLLWVDSTGQGEALPAPKQNYQYLSLSPDASRIAIAVFADGGSQDIWTFDLARETMTRLTFEGANITPLWTPDGRRVIFASDREGQFNLYWKPADGSGPAERLHESEYIQYPTGISSDGETLAFVHIGATGGRDVWVMSMEGDRAQRPFVESSFDEMSATFAPNGRWIAYSSSESGRTEIYVRPHPGPGGMWQVSRDGGRDPVWSRDGTEIFFRNADRMMSVAVETDAGFSVGTPKLVFEANYYDGIARYYDVTGEGDRFLMIEAPDTQEGTAAFRVVTNWFDELERLVPTKP